MIRRQTLDVDAPLWKQQELRVRRSGSHSSIALYYCIPPLLRSSYLSGVLVYGDVNDTVVIAALFQDGLLNDLVPVLAHLPERERERVALPIAVLISL